MLAEGLCVYKQLSVFASASSCVPIKESVMFQRDGGSQLFSSALVSYSFFSFCPISVSVLFYVLQLSSVLLHGGLLRLIPAVMGGVRNRPWTTHFLLDERHLHATPFSFLLLIYFCIFAFYSFSFLLSFEALFYFPFLTLCFPEVSR